MNRSLCLTIFAVAAAVPLDAIVNLERLAKEADAIVVGRASQGVDVPGGVRFNLSVVRAVQGKFDSGQLLNVVARLRPDSRLTPSNDVKGECGLFLLKRTGDAWEALGGDYSPFFSDARIALGECEAAAPARVEGLSAFEKSFAEAALAARRLPEQAVTTMRLFELGGLSGSPLVAGIMKEFAQSDAPHLRAEGVAYAVGRGDASALLELARLVTATTKPFRPQVFLSAVSEYVNPDRSGVLALGRLVFDPNLPADYLKANAANALRNIHTRDAVPFLGQMLYSEDINIRNAAVSGLTQYVAGVGPLPDGPEKREALDKAFNPGRRKTPFSVPREYLRMGPFPDASEEARLLTFWRGWWEANRHEFAAPAP